MNMEYTAIITKDEDWWLGWIEEIPGANAQERTKEELLISLREAANDIIELRQNWIFINLELNHLHIFFLKGFYQLPFFFIIIIFPT